MQSQVIPSAYTRDGSWADFNLCVLAGPPESQRLIRVASATKSSAPPVITQPWPPNPWPPVIEVTWDQNSFPGAYTGTFDIGVTGDLATEAEANSMAAELNATKLFPAELIPQVYIYEENVYSGIPPAYDFWMVYADIPGANPLADPYLGLVGQLINARVRPGTHWEKGPSGVWSLLWV